MVEPNQDKRIQKASRRRREQQKAETRKAIVDAATELFLAHGYQGFSLRQVAEQIGYSPGTIYLYFSNKDDLLFTIADEGFRRFGDYLQTAVDSTDDPLQQIIAMGEAYVRFGMTYPVNYRLMFMERTDFMIREHESGEVWMDTFMILYRTVQQALEHEAIVGKNAEVMSDSIWAMLHGAVALALQMHYIDEARIERMLDSVRHLIHKSLLPDAS